MKRLFFGIAAFSLLSSVGCMSLEELNPWSEPGIPEPITPPGSTDIMPDHTGGYNALPAQNYQGGAQPGYPGGLQPQGTPAGGFSQRNYVDPNDITMDNYPQQMDAYQQELSRDLSAPQSGGYAFAEGTAMQQR